MEFDPILKYIVWEDGGCEGWHPYSYNTLKEAVSHQGYCSHKIITKQVEFVVQEKE